jgi:hypothetical protein
VHPQSWPEDLDHTGKRVIVIGSGATAAALVPAMAETGLDEHQVRRWTPWRRWTVIAMLAYALLAVLAATEQALHPAPAGLIALTCNEIHRLFNRLILEPARRLTNPLTWSDGRRRHQYRARASHYQRRPET